MKVMIIVTHLLGTGHLTRALTLARGFAEAGDEVLLASGGMPVPHLDFSGLRVLQLPPLRSDGTAFTRLLTDRDTLAGADDLAARGTALAEAVQAFAPDALICELFPFGRRVLADEFTAALQAARALPKPALCFCSIRDILAPPSKPEKAARADRLIAALFDGVLVHSDPAATRLEASWPVSDTLAPYLHYTGYVAPPAAAPHPDQAGTGEVLVTAGGGSVGDGLFRAALQAAAADPQARTWRLLVGGTDRDARIAALSALAPGNAVLQPTRPDFRQMLHHAAASVSMCGYNTALDLLQSGTPAVLIPFDDGQEVEQTLRARSLAQLPGLAVLPDADLSGPALLAALDRATGTPRRAAAGLRFDGASETVRRVRSMVEQSS